MSLSGPVGLGLLLLGSGIAILLIVALLGRSRPPASRIMPPREARVISHTTAFNRADPLEVVSTLPPPPPRARDRHSSIVAAQHLSASEQALFDFLHTSLGESFRILPKVPLADLARKLGDQVAEPNTPIVGDYVEMLVVDPRTGHPLLVVEVEGLPTRWEREEAALRKQELLRRLKLPIVRLRRGGYWGYAEKEMIYRALPH